MTSLVGRQRMSEPSREKLRIQNIVETLCPRLCECKVILQEIIWSLTPDRCYKKMTQALAERAVEVTSNVSYLLEGAEETPQLIDNIFHLEQTLRDIQVFAQSETQRNLLLRILFAKNLRVRYFSLDKQLRELLKPFEQKIVKKPLVSCVGSTIQENHPGVISQQDGALAEIVPSNNSSAIHASGSIFHHANNTVVRGGNFYATHNLVVKQVQDYDQTPQGIVEGADVFTPGDVIPENQIYKGRGYRVYSAHSTAKARAVTIKLYEGSRAKDRCLAAASFSQKFMHPNLLHLIGVSPLNSELPFLVFDEGTEWAIESIIASALSKDLRQSLFLGLQTVAGLSSGLDYLRNLLYPFASVGLDHFVVGSGHGNILISFDPEVLPDETHEHDQRSGASDDGSELDIFHGLCQRTFDAACKAHYEFQKVQRSIIDELDADHDLDQDRFEEIEDDAGTLLVDAKAPISDVLNSAPSTSQLHAALPTTSESSLSESLISLRKSSPSARRELVWKSQNNETVSLEEIARQFQSFLLTFSTEVEFNRRRGRYTTKTAHRCPGYNRIEITLTPDIARSAIVSHLTPIPHEICPVCKEIVKDAEIFACICGRDDNESIPTIRCSTCSEWHHRPCIGISENEDQSFVCQRCTGNRPWEHRMKEWGSTTYEGLKKAIQGIYDCSGIFPPLQTTAGILLTISKVVDRVSANRTDLEQLRVKLQSILSIISKYRDNGGLRALDYRVEKFCLAISLQIDAVQKVYGNSLWIRTPEGTKDADAVLKVFRNISTLCDVFQTDIQLHTEVKVEEIFKRLESRSIDKLDHGMSSYKDGNPPGCMTGTRVKILADLEAWASHDLGSKVYWLVGMAGTGKTTILHSLCEIVDMKNMLGGSFFCFRGWENACNASLIVPTIAHSLASTSPCIRSEVIKAIENDPKLAEPTYINLVGQFNKLIRDPIQVSVGNAVKTYKIIVIDAVDECSDLPLISSLIRLILESASTIPLKILIASRDEPLIRKAFTSVPRLPTVFYLHELDKDVVKSDRRLDLSQDVG